MSVTAWSHRLPFRFYPNSQNGRPQRRGEWVAAAIIDEIDGLWRRGGSFTRETAMEWVKFLNPTTVALSRLVPEKEGVRKRWLVVGRDRWWRTAAVEEPDLGSRSLSESGSYAAASSPSSSPTASSLRLLTFILLIRASNRLRYSLVNLFCFRTSLDYLMGVSEGWNFDVFGFILWNENNLFFHKLLIEVELINIVFDPR